MQELKETVDEIVKDHDRLFSALVNSHKEVKEPYWIVMFCKPAKQNLNGKHTLIRYMKAHFKKPDSKVGMIIWEINNQTGEIVEEINMPDIPFDYDALRNHGAKEGSKKIETLETSTIADSYITAH